MVWILGTQYPAPRSSWVSPSVPVHARLRHIVDRILGQCESQIHVSRSLVSLRYSTAVDIITDALIIALPLYLAFRVQRPLSQKLALGTWNLEMVLLI